MRGAWWWIDRWRRSSAFIDFTLAQQGAYRNLIDELWLRGGVLPDDDRTLARASGDPMEWPAMRERVMAKFYRTEAGWRHTTVDEVMGKSGDLREKRATAGRKGFEKVARGEKGHFTGNNGQTDGQTTPDATGNATGNTDGQTTAYPVAVSVLRNPSQEPEPSNGTVSHAGADWTPRAEPLVAGRRPVLETEWLRLVREIAAGEKVNPEDVPPAWEGRRGINPADLTDARLLRDLADLRARRAALEPKAPPAGRDTADDELHAKRHDLASEFLAWYRLHPLEGIFEGHAGMHGVAFGAWPRAAKLPAAIADVVRKEALAILARPVPEEHEPADPSKPHPFEADSRMREKSGRSSLCWCTKRADDPLHGAV
jgi:uncharacterized protein YdaU (DUF1376 family)